MSTPNAWIAVEKELPQEGRHVDAWLSRGRRVADCYWQMNAQGTYRTPYWYYRNGFGVWKAFQKQDVTHWMATPNGPNGEVSSGSRDE